LWSGDGRNVDVDLVVARVRANRAVDRGGEVERAGGTAATDQVDHVGVGDGRQAQGKDAEKRCLLDCWIFHFQRTLNEVA
jgi:hypothetical protein